MSPENKKLTRQIKEILNGRPPKRIDDEKNTFIHAGVLIPLLEEDGEPRILFTKRTDTVEHHKGQISFPGGRVDAEDGSLEETALREAFEEIGLLREDVEILGRIDDAETVSTNYIVHPFVGSMPYPYDLTLSNEEVDRVIIVPLTVFHPDHADSRGYEYEDGGQIYPTTTFEYNGDIIWGATARIMENFMEIVGEKINLPEINR